MWLRRAMNKIWKTLFSLTNMAGMAKPARCKGYGMVRGRARGGKGSL